NIFVLFRWVLRVFDRAVRTFVEPVGMLFDVRVIGRAIDREIKGDFHSALAHLFLKPVEIFQRTERRLDRLVSASFAADRPWHPWLARFVGSRVISPFPIGVPNRMN